MSLVSIQTPAFISHCLPIQDRIQACRSKIGSGKANFYDQLLASFVNKTRDLFTQFLKVIQLPIKLVLEGSGGMLLRRKILNFSSSEMAF